MAVGTQHHIGIFSESFAGSAENLAVLVGRGVAHGIRQIDDVGARLGGGLYDFDEETVVGAAGILSGELDVVAVLPAVVNHGNDLSQGFSARNSQFVLQMKIRCSEEDVKARFGGGFEGAERSFNVFQAGASQGRDAA